MTRQKCNLKVTKNQLLALLDQAYNIMINDHNLRIPIGDLADPTDTYQRIRYEAESYFVGSIGRYLNDPQTLSPRDPTIMDYGAQLISSVPYNYYALINIRDLRDKLAHTREPRFLFITVPVTHYPQIYHTLDAARRDLQKASGNILYVLSVVLNNATAKTLEEVVRFFRDYPDIDSTILQIPPENGGSLPQALNLAYSYERKFLSDLDIVDQRSVFYMYVDDDGVILDFPDGSGIETNIIEFDKNPNLRLISGQAVDTRIGVSYFHRYANVSTRPEVVKRLKPKPYGQGGAGGMIIRFRDYPEQGLPECGLGGVSLGAYMHTLVTPEEIRSLNHDDWITRTNPRVPWQHNTRENLGSWAAHYKALQVAWGSALDKFDSPSTRIWRYKIKPKAKKVMKRMIATFVPEVISPQDYLGHLLIKEYFLSLLRNDSFLTYRRLKPFANRVHGNI